ncbi:Der1-like family-domain-containing protein [Chaetomium sp. MPI-SDFR-AT-0129]|nr:Der1-like family-domain-containing protein [Chaetomium sp. MPI-SDFR-AT-0129]
MPSEVMDAYWAAPAMARNLATLIVVTSIAAHFGFVSYGWLYFGEDRLLRFPPEIWRFATNFFLSGPKLGIILDPYFTYQYLKQLETANPKFSRKEDLVWYLMTVGGMIIFLNRAFLGGGFFLGGLIMALAYTATQDQRGIQSGFIVFTVPAQSIPLCMLALSLLLDPSAIPLQLTGLLSAHLHDFLSRLWPEFGGGWNIMTPPRFVSWLVKTPRMVQREYGTAVHQPRGAHGVSGGSAAGGSSGASTGSVLPDSWKTRGSGQRLGGN